YQLIGLLDNPDVEIKGHMLRILGRLKAKEVAGKIRMLLDDTSQLTIYENGVPLQTDIGSLAKEALQLMEAEGEERQ
ncbi:MAG: hypothetical protein R3297_03900, partial [Desulfobulbales bacterium]|nr:hypothetical protein [Desulfobulbales bacterium]